MTYELGHSVTSKVIDDLRFEVYNLLQLGFPQLSSPKVPQMS